MIRDFQGGLVVDAPPDAAFPLFTPEGELSWADGWTFQRIFPLNEGDTEGALFSTRDERGREMIWRIQVLDPPRRSAYYVVTGGSHATEISVVLNARPDGRTDVAVRYVYIPFTADGAAFVEKFTDESYRERMKSWERAIRTHLKTL